ncbi:hypothetical protein [Burkholderia cenocepacia]|uniref:hypothetical protein n=1 Tax=Burkholderia cenocepacia TaxID=95486 RepID=UPI00158A4DDC|nr:hypothetical protein [Burkholderia cenocepacia]
MSHDLKAVFKDIDVEKQPDGTPILLARWGYVIVEYAGKKYLAAATEEETRAALAKSAHTNFDPAYCAGGPFGCIQGDCHKLCHPTPLGGGNWVCLCG